MGGSRSRRRRRACLSKALSLFLPSNQIKRVFTSRDRAAAQMHASAAAAAATAVPVPANISRFIQFHSS